MAWRCCCRSPARHKLKAAIRERLKRIGEIYPGTHFISIITSEGKTIDCAPAQQAVDGDVGEVVAEELLQQVISLKKAAVQFGSSLSQGIAGVIHIRGKNSLFSCYDVDEAYLAFYTDMPQLAGFNLAKADVLMERLIEDLRPLLNTLYVTT